MAGTEVATRLGGPDEESATAAMVLGKIEAVLNNGELKGEDVVIGGITWFMKAGRVDGTGTKFDGTEVACMRQRDPSCPDEELFSARLEVTYKAYPVITYGYGEHTGYSLTTPTGTPEYVEVGSRQHLLNCFVLDKTVFQPVSAEARPSAGATILQLPVMAPYGSLSEAA